MDLAGLKCLDTPDSIWMWIGLPSESNDDHVNRERTGREGEIKRAD